MLIFAPEPIERNVSMANNGLYQSSWEHDSCGVGMVVNIHGGKTHQLVEDALTVLENMRHRGAEVGKDGDGAGILLQIPHEFILLSGIPVPEKGKYATGLVFLPKDSARQQNILAIIIEEIEREGLQLMHLRQVPVESGCLGERALATEPDIKQIFITGISDDKVDAFQRILYLVRKRIEKRVDDKDFYFCSLSNSSIVYKGMLSSIQLRQFYPDLTNPYFTSGLAVVHSRFSTNTFPTWSLAQPFRLLAHNGEINTIRGNRGWMKARESVLSSEALGDIRNISPIIQPGMSDSASLDNVLEFFMMSGMSLPHAMALLIPESFNDKNPIPEDLKAFYEYYSILMEPWDGPAALLFSDGRFAGGMLDRNGLRPARYTITKSDTMVVASEVGVMDFDPTQVASPARQDSADRHPGRQNILRRRDQAHSGRRASLPSVALNQPHPVGETAQWTSCLQRGGQSALQRADVRLWRRGYLRFDNPYGHRRTGTYRLYGQ